VTRNLEPNDVRVGGHHERTIPGPSMDTNEVENRKQVESNINGCFEMKMNNL
jgi:hypothetical protein